MNKNAIFQEIAGLMTSFTERVYGIFDVFLSKNDKNFINKK